MRNKSDYANRFRTALIGLAKIGAYFAFRSYLKITRRQIRVMSIEESLKLILKHRLSISRFGDGEFKWMFGTRESNNFEKNSSELAAALKKVIKTDRKGFKVCIPDVFSGLGQYRKADALFWAGQLGHHGYHWIHELDSNRVYLDALVTRPYMSYKDRDKAKCLFKTIKKIWEGRHVIIVEGAETRFGVGNDLIDGAEGISRIICPAENAFEHYKNILAVVLKKVQELNDPNVLVLVSLGPTATVLANDVNLKTSAQVLDIGHLDLEYSWMLMKTSEKVPLRYKYVNEVKNGNRVQNIPSEFMERYNSEIVAEIK